MTIATVDPIPSLAHDVRTLFEGPLDGVAFPGVDVVALDELVARVSDAATALDEARGVVEARARALDEAQRALLRLAERAVAYARVFADGEGDDALRARLDALRPARGSSERPRDVERPARRRKPAAEGASELPLAVDASAASSA